MEYQCQLCPKSFSHKRNLTRHLTSHNKSTYECSTCPQTFGRKDHLKRHEDSHTNNEYKCDTCQQSFGRKDHLKRHKISHQFNKDKRNIDIVLDYVCDCGEAFSRRDIMKKHALTHSRYEPQSKRLRITESADEPSSSTHHSHHDITAPTTNPDTTLEDVLSQSDYEPRVIDFLKSHWSSIKNYFKCQTMQDISNVCLLDESDSLRFHLTDIWRKEIKCRVKMNCSPGFLLEHKTTSELRYFHSSSNNMKLFDNPKLIATEASLMDFIQELEDLDILEHVRQQRPDTAWRIVLVTNVTFYISKILHMGKIGSGENLPDYLIKHKAMLSLNRDSHWHLYDDNLCFFRCLSIRLLCQCKGKCSCIEVDDKHVHSLIGKYRTHVEAKWSISQFKGVDLKDLLSLEELFDVSIIVFQLDPDGSSNVIWNSKSVRTTKLNINLHDSHFSLIKHVEIFAKAYDCLNCERSFNQLIHLKRHKCQDAGKFPSKTFSPNPTIFDLLHEEGIFVELSQRYYPYRITYDIETYHAKDDLPPSTARMNFTSQQELLSISVCSNVPKFDQAKCFISDGDTTKTIKEFLNYIEEIAVHAYDIVARDLAGVRFQLMDLLLKRQKKEEAYADREWSGKRTYDSRSIGKLVERFNKFLRVIPVVGFNSQRFDLNVMKGPLLKHLHQTGKISYTVKRDTRLQCNETDSFRFLDITSFISPGFNYDKYLKAFDCSVSKGFFPYEWFDSLDKLDNSSLPSHSDFYSDLKESNISEEEYAYCQRVWSEQGMKTMRDFLVWYNNLDVVPFLEAIEKQSSIYREKGIDMLRDAISLPGLAVRWMFTEVDRESFDITLIDEKNKDLYTTVKQNLVGGPSIVFHRYHEKGLTKLREFEFGGETKTCDEILGVDANALYLWSMMQEMPTGPMIRRRPENGFKAELTQRFGRKAWAWMEYISKLTGERIEHMFNKGEKRVGQHGLPVDGFCSDSNTVYQFHGCAFHGHRCDLTSGLTHHPYKPDVSMAKLRYDTSAKDKYIRDLGYNLVVMRECEWMSLIRADEKARLFDASFNNHFKATPKCEAELIEWIKSGKLFGLAEVDIAVPESLRSQFAEMPPIFKNIEVTREDLSDHMRDFASNTDHLKRGQRMLIGSMIGERVLLYTPLIKWYLEKGLVISKVHQVIQYQPVKCFEKFGESVSNARRMGDSDPSKALLADTCKLIGNSVYGKTITNQERHRNIKYADDLRKASNKVKSPHFIGLEEIDDTFFEITMDKTQITLNTPIIIGFSILQMAKLRMLQFYYDFMLKFVDLKDFQYIEMDTDSAYMALSGPLTSIVKPS